ncbi:hypothetical protein BOVATA_026670 [Babesia ovata]|uniref:Uncharacterized protein n=1 Tax=Babesia ovata TaxID=189622 RepID=A0A2H6KDW9_9APIC|nr:uncharacterized protein BOVATA_026670 [Babesia ovata]GBE61174.1 hypothetical protein BOVATA_026670 [Babesia ovata]
MLENLIKSLQITSIFKRPAKRPNRLVNCLDFTVKRPLDMRTKLSVKITRRRRNFGNMILIQLRFRIFNHLQLATYKTTTGGTASNLLIKPLNPLPQHRQIILHQIIQSLNFQVPNNPPYSSLNLIFHLLQIPLEITVHFHNSLQGLADFLANFLLGRSRSIKKCCTFAL